MLGRIADANHLRTRPEPEQPPCFSLCQRLRRKRLRAAPMRQRYPILRTCSTAGMACSWSAPTQCWACLEGSAEEAELALLTAIIEAYEHRRWPEGRIPGGRS